jgi:hypothetical protein
VIEFTDPHGVRVGLFDVVDIAGVGTNARLRRWPTKNEAKASRR